MCLVGARARAASSSLRCDAMTGSSLFGFAIYSSFLSRISISIMAECGSVAVWLNPLYIYEIIIQHNHIAFDVHTLRVILLNPNLIRWNVHTVQTMLLLIGLAQHRTAHTHTHQRNTKEKWKIASHSIDRSLARYTCTGAQRNYISRNIFILFLRFFFFFVHFAPDSLDGNWMSNASDAIWIRALHMYAFGSAAKPQFVFQ